MCFCIVLHYTGGNDILCLQVYTCTPQVDLPLSIKRWTHGFSKHTSLESDASRLTRYLCHDPCCVCVAKSNYHCCLLFRRIKYIYGHTSVLKIWDRLYVMAYMYLACTYVYMLYIYSTNILLDMGRKTMLKLLLSLGKWSIMPCHGFGENVKPGADALKQTLKAIIYVICIMQHNASALTWYAVHQQVSPNCPMSQ